MIKRGSVVFWVFWFVWLTTVFTLVVLGVSEHFIKLEVNTGFGIAFIILTVTRLISKRFNKWLDSYLPVKEH